MRGRRLGPYVIEEELGRGGMGIVYKATQPDLSRSVAVKVLPAHLAGQENAVERFQREARAAARLDHPNIVTVHDVGKSDGLYYFAMQYLPGITLEQLIARQGRISLAKTVEFARQLVSALGYAHRNGVIHRDVKPSNIILHQDDHRPLLTDFGIALAGSETRLTESGKIFGSPTYMSPEQLEGKELDHRSDLYSLGAVIFEMVAGRPPFHGNSAVAILHNRLREPNRSLSDLDSTVPPAFNAFVRRLMAVRVEDRFQDAEATLAALDQVGIDNNISDEDPGPFDERTVPLIDPTPATRVDERPREAGTTPVQANINETPGPGRDVRDGTLTPAPAIDKPGSTRRQRWPWLVGAVTVVLLLVWLVPDWPDNSQPVSSPESESMDEGADLSPAEVETGIKTEPLTFLTHPDASTSGEEMISADPVKSSASRPVSEPESRDQPKYSPDSGTDAVVPPPARASAINNRPGEEASFEVSANIRMAFAWIPAGQFFMGSPGKEKERQKDEAPLHAVEITRGFWIGRYEVTQGQWTAVMGGNPSTFSGSHRPVENVTWSEAQVFIRTINHSSSDWVYRLPTESEWEYCCRAGTTTPFNRGGCLPEDMVNCDGRFPYDGCDEGKWRMETTRVGSYPPNAWNLHDMHGNVAEWCSDWYGSTWYTTSPGRDPRGPQTGSRRVIRGGSWNQGAQRCRSADRQQQAPGHSDENLGFRVVREVK